MACSSGHKEKASWPPVSGRLELKCRMDEMVNGIKLLPPLNQGNVDSVAQEYNKLCRRTARKARRVDGEAWVRLPGVQPDVNRVYHCLSYTTIWLHSNKNNMILIRQLCKNWPASQLAMGMQEFGAILTFFFSIFTNAAWNRWTTCLPEASLRQTHTDTSIMALFSILTKADDFHRMAFLRQRSNILKPWSFLEELFSTGTSKRGRQSHSLLLRTRCLEKLLPQS